MAGSEVQRGLDPKSVTQAHWRGDLLAAVSVSLVALPLGLGIALASGAPPISGLIAAIVGGLVTTLLRSSRVAINGPGAGLIVAVLGGVEALGDNGVGGFPYVLAAIVVAGLIQAVLGLFRLGDLGELLPSSVLHGMLAAIGLIIVAKQLHVALGADTISESALDAFMKVPLSLQGLNPFVAAIAAIGLLIMILHPKVRNRFIHSVPSALWVLLVSIPMVFAFNLFRSHDIQLFDLVYHVGPEYLIDVPDKILSSLLFPNFSKIALPEFWVTVLSIVLLGSVETLVSTKAVDKLDPLKRRSDLNKDLTAVGLSTALSGLIGGLPVVTVIVRSSINVNHGARTGWSNFFHGCILLILVLFFPWFIREIPKAALAAILIYTGYKLAAPKVFRDMALKGWEQLVFFTTTLLACVAFGLLWGIVIGMSMTLFVHLLRSQLQLSTFLRHAIHPDIHAEVEEVGTRVRVKGIANFFAVLKLQRTFRSVPTVGRLVVDLSQARLVDSTVLELIHEHGERTGRTAEIVGLDLHRTSSGHPNALHVLRKPVPKRLTRRQLELMREAQVQGLRYRPEMVWDIHPLAAFSYFGQRMASHRSNVIEGVLGENEVPFEIFDLTYSEGVLTADEEHNFTLALVHLPGLPRFTMSREEMINWKEDRASERRSLRLQQMLGRTFFGDRSAEEALHGLADQLLPFLRAHDPHYIASNSEGLLIIGQERLASTAEVHELHAYCLGLVSALPEEYVPRKNGRVVSHSA